MSIKLIRQAFESRLNTWANTQTPKPAIAWQNASFTPPTALYLRAFLLPASSDSRQLDGSDRIMRGVFQINIVAPLNAGAGAAETVAEALCTLFTKANNPYLGGTAPNQVDVWITDPMSQASAIEGPDRYTVPLSCGYQAFA